MNFFSGDLFTYLVKMTGKPKVFEINISDKKSRCFDLSEVILNTWKWPRRGRNIVTFYRYYLSQNRFLRNYLLKPKVCLDKILVILAGCSLLTPHYFKPWNSDIRQMHSGDKRVQRCFEFAKKYQKGYLFLVLRFRVGTDPSCWESPNDIYWLFSNPP